MAQVPGHDTYTRYKPIVRRHDYRQMFVGYLGEQVQMDLVDIGKYRRDNGGVYWILTAIEIFSRYAFAIPVYRRDTCNMAKAVTMLLKQCKDRFGDYPKLAQFNDGKEFYNVVVKAFLEKHGVKYFYAKGTYNWTNALDLLVSNYNGTKHSTILMKPKYVSEKNESQV